MRAISLHRQQKIWPPHNSCAHSRFFLYRVNQHCSDNHRHLPAPLYSFRSNYQLLSLSLLVFRRARANHIHHTATLNDSTVVTNFFHRCSNFHRSILQRGSSYQIYGVFSNFAPATLLVKLPTTSRSTEYVRPPFSNSY